MVSCDMSTYDIQFARQLATQYRTFPDTPSLSPSLPPIRHKQQNFYPNSILCSQQNTTTTTITNHQIIKSSNHQIIKSSNPQQPTSSFVSFVSNPVGQKRRWRIERLLTHSFFHVVVIDRFTPKHTHTNAHTHKCYYRMIPPPNVTLRYVLSTN